MTVLQEVVIGLQIGGYIALGFMFLTMILILIQYRYFVIIRNMGAKKSTLLWEIALCKVKTRSDGSSKLQRLIKRKDFVPLCPNESRGLIKILGIYTFALATKTAEGTIAWMQINDEDLNKLDHISETQRSQYVAEFKEAQEIKKNWKDLIMPLAIMTLLAMVSVAHLVLWEDFTKPGLQATGSLERAAKSFEIASADMKEVILEKQKIAVKNVNPELPEEPPQ